MNNTEMIELVAGNLDDLKEDALFLGGAVTGLLITDPAAAKPRFTADVDVVVNVASYPRPTLSRQSSTHFTDAAKATFFPAMIWRISSLSRMVERS